MKKRIALLTGGESAEREVALLSAKNVQTALLSRFEVEVFDFPKDIDRFVESRLAFDMAVPIFHGKGGEDGVIQGFLEALGVPYIFSGVEAHAIGMDKAMCKKLVSCEGIKTAEWSVVKGGDVFTWKHPVVVKPVCDGSSFGVKIIHDEASLQEVLAEKKEVLVEDFIQGREFTVAVIEREGEVEALPVIEIRSKNEFFDYESKYDPTLCEELCPAPIEKELAGQLQDLGLRVHALIGARHLSRTDMIVDDVGGIWFLEINTIPGLTSESLTPKAISTGGLSLEDLLDGWISEQDKRTA